MRTYEFRDYETGEVKASGEYENIEAARKVAKAERETLGCVTIVELAEVGPDDENPCDEEFRDEGQTWNCSLAKGHEGEHA